MGLIAPLFLLGALTLALPIWLHRLKTQSSERQRFSSAMLLEMSEERVHVRRQIKYLLLLTLRILLLLALVFAFAQPYWERPPALIVAGASGTELVMVDTSASMGRTGVFEQALAEARGAIDDAPAGAALLVVDASDSLTTISEPSDDRSAHRSALASLSVTALRLDFGAAMQEIGQIAATLPQPVRLHFVSDFQASGMPVRFADLVPANVSELVAHPVGTGEPSNWSIEFLRETAAGVEVGARSSGTSERVADIELVVNDGPAVVESLSDRGKQTVRFAGLEYVEGDNRVRVTITTDDDLDADNRWHAVVENEPPVPVPLLTAAPDALPVTYMQAALEAAAAGGYRVELLVPGEFDTRVLSRHRWLLIDDLAALDPLHADAVQSFIAAGGSVLAFVGSRAASLETLPVSGHTLGAASLGANASRFLSVGRISGAHPALSGTEGWFSVSVERSLPLERQAEDRVLVELEDGTPFVLERAIGDGRLLLVADAADNRLSDFPVRPVFVSFMIEAAAYLAGTTVFRKNYLAGARLPLSLVGGASGQVIDPEGRTVLSLADTTRAQQIKLDKPGIYEVYRPQGEALVAANIDPRESELRPIGQALLDRWLESALGAPAGGGSSIAAPDPEQLELWHWLLFGLALLVIGESVLGNSYLRTRAGA